MKYFFWRILYGRAFVNEMKWLENQGKLLDQGREDEAIQNGIAFKRSKGYPA